MPPVASYMDLIQPLAARLPYMVTVGNHEIDNNNNPTSSGGDSGGECGVPTFKRFPFFPSLQEMWYGTHETPRFSYLLRYLCTQLCVTSM